MGTGFFRFVTIHTFGRQTDRKAFTIPCVTLHAVDADVLNVLDVLKSKLHVL